ncbi:MAG: outer membrane beta-barrel protein [Rhizobiaceae bacterium]|nr:outer membrane beta-barrel protein [Rhizobiaceae bacterium]
MVRAFRTLLTAGVAFAAFVPAAFSADLDAPIFVEQAPEIVPVEIGNGWYLRADIGYAVSESDGPFHYNTYDPATNSYGSADFVTGGLSQDFSGGLGVGYQFNQWFRGDATIDMFSGDFQGTTASNQPCSTDPTYVGTTCRSTDAATYDAYTAMANGYVDLGTFVGITPYVGAGAGFTWINYGGLTNALFCVDGTAACPPGPSPVDVAVHAGETDARFTYALMAGASYDVTQNLKLDLGYKYTKIDGGAMFAFDPDSQAAGAQGTQGYDKGLERHDVRLGIRYSLW